MAKPAKMKGKRVKVHNVSGRRCVSGSSTGGYAKIHLSTGTLESCNYSRMGRPILGCSEGTGPTYGTTANPIMVPSPSTSRYSTEKHGTSDMMPRREC